MTERTLPERLRDVAHADDYARIEAADALDAKSALLADAETALEPFAAFADRLDKDAGGPFPDTAPIGYAPQYEIGSRPNIDDTRIARVVLAKLKAAQSS